MPLRRISCLLAVTLALAASAALARDARIVGVTQSSDLPVVRPDTPVPDDPGLVFYLQRSTNRNTVVYVANFDSEGRLDPDDPLSVYWRRFSESGQPRRLNLIERTLAYGVSVSAGGDPGSYRVAFRAVPDMGLTLSQSAPFQATLHAEHDGTRIDLIYGHVEAIDGLIPEVVEILFFGRAENGRFARIVLVPE